jgi:hypothetical protein
MRGIPLLWCSSGEGERMLRIVQKVLRHSHYRGRIGKSETFLGPRTAWAGVRRSPALSILHSLKRLERCPPKLIGNMSACLRNPCNSAAAFHSIHDVPANGTTAPLLGDEWHGVTIRRGVSNNLEMAAGAFLGFSPTSSQPLPQNMEPGGPTMSRSWSRPKAIACRERVRTGRIK